MKELKNYNDLLYICERIHDAIFKGKDTLAVKHLNEVVNKAVAVKHKQIKDTLLGMQRIHKHNSIPCLVEEDDCLICVRNKTIKEMLKTLNGGNGNNRA